MRPHPRAPPPPRRAVSPVRRPDGWGSVHLGVYGTNVKRRPSLSRSQIRDRRRVPAMTRIFFPSPLVVREGGETARSAAGQGGWPWAAVLHGRTPTQSPWPVGRVGRTRHSPASTVSL